ncbi:MAG: rRNA maturation RNase YbeY [Fimbriimonadaceae bacterium]|nr:rRNA maturation RNase YbeY [Fimbriimonadaceae bacterium]
MIHLSNRSPSRLKGDRIREALEALLSHYQRSDMDIEVVLMADEEIAGLNSAFRDLPEPTDVLSFPAPTQTHGWLGEIAISVDFARRQSKARGVSVSDEAAMLAIHGGLHLLGFDDESDEDRDDMVRRMNEIAIKVGLRADENWHSAPHNEVRS